MNVLLVSSKYLPEYAGSGLRAHNTYKRLSDKYDITFEVVTSSVTENHSESYTVEGVSVTRIANKKAPFKRPATSSLFKRILNGLRYRWHWQRNYWREALPMFRFLFKHGSRFDLIHVFGNVTITSVAITYAKFARKPLIVELVNMVHNPNQYEPRLFSAFWGKGFPKWALIVCLSEQLHQACLNHGYDDQQIWTRPNPIDETRFHLHPSPVLPREWQNIEPSDVVILQLAKFIPRKHQRFMIDVLAHLPPHYKLILAGPLVHEGLLEERDKAYYNSIFEAIEVQNLTDRVQLIPEFIENPETFMQAASVFVLPSDDEAFGTVFLEAIACGTPVVVNDIPGVFDQCVQPGINGYICKRDDKLWAQHIEQALDIDIQTMQKAADKVLQTASTSAIDETYLTHLKHRINQYASD